MPKSRFIFDQYKVQDDEDVEQSDNGRDNDYFSYFSSHEKAILAPESSFKNVSKVKYRQS